MGKKSYNIRNNATIDTFIDPSLQDVETITISKYFDNCDDDTSNRFSYLRNLQEFKVNSSDSPFFTYKGVLFCDADSIDHMFNNMLSYWKSNVLHGIWLIAYPTAYPQKKFIIPEGVVGINHGAFEGTNIEELSLPRSLEYIGFHALDRTPNLKELRVPNKFLDIRDIYHIGGGDAPLTIYPSDSNELSEEYRDQWINCRDGKKTCRSIEIDFRKFELSKLMGMVDEDTRKSYNNEIAKLEKEEELLWAESNDEDTSPNIIWK